jgi:hypothetical protein
MAEILKVHDGKLTFVCSPNVPAGIAMAVSFISAMTGLSVNKTAAFTGALDLRYSLTCTCHTMGPLSPHRQFGLSLQACDVFAEGASRKLWAWPRKPRLPPRLE